MLFRSLSAECTPDRALSAQVLSAAEHRVWSWQLRPAKGTCGEATCSPTTDRRPRRLQCATPRPTETAYPRLLTRNSPGSEGVTSLTDYQRARMASPASQDALTYNLQPHPTLTSLTISYFILVLPVAHSPSPTHHTMLSILPNVSHIARCIISQLITTPTTLSIRPGVVSRVSIACPHPSCLRIACMLVC